MMNHYQTLSYKKKAKKRSVLSVWMLLVSLIPYVDALNGFLIKNRGTYGIGEAYHALLMIVGLFLLFQGNPRRNVYVKIFIICTLSLVIQIGITALLYEEISKVAFGRAIKYLATVEFLASFYRMSEKISQSQFKRLITWQFDSIILITIFADVSGLANHTYTNLGRVGFYAGSNEPTIIFLILQVFLLYQISQEKKIKLYVFFFLGELCLVFTESKSGIALAIVFGLLLISITAKDILGRNRTRGILFLIVIGVIAIIGIQFFRRNILESFLYRQNYIASRLRTVSNANYLTSGRISRFERLIGEPFAKYVRNYSWGGYIIVFLKSLFGFGLSGSMLTTFEMDYFDMFVYGGIIWLVVMTFETIHILRIIWKKHNKLVIRLSYILVIVSSFLVGHMWVGGNSGIYFAMLSVYLMKI